MRAREAKPDEPDFRVTYDPGHHPQARLVAFSLAAQLPHPSRKNKDAAKVGHPGSILVGQFSTQLYLLQIALVRA